VYLNTLFLKGEWRSDDKCRETAVVGEPLMCWKQEKTKYEGFTFGKQLQFQIESVQFVVCAIAMLVRE
jgi:hypothetical protein